jgi:hypothetical protein
MNRLPREIILVVCSIFKKHKYILNFLSINTEMHELKTKVDFDKEWVLYENVVNLSYKNKYKAIVLSWRNTKGYRSVLSFVYSM